jgi:hypothetical protein
VTEGPEFLVSVTAPHFCAATVWHGPWCVQAAPILRWAEGLRWEPFERYCKKKGWRLHVHEQPATPPPKLKRPSARRKP